MFASSGYFAHLSCPFFASGLCTRANCHFAHKPNTSSDVNNERSVSEAAFSEDEEDHANNCSIKPTYDCSGRRLFLPPKDAPHYEPTPVSADALIGSVSSDEDDDNDNKDDVIGNILREGKGSGVMAMDERQEMEHEIIKEKLRIKGKRLKEQEERRERGHKVKRERDNASEMAFKVSREKNDKKWSKTQSQAKRDKMGSGPKIEVISAAVSDNNGGESGSRKKKSGDDGHKESKRRKQSFLDVMGQLDLLTSKETRKKKSSKSGRDKDREKSNKCHNKERKSREPSKSDHDGKTNCQSLKVVSKLSAIGNKEQAEHDKSSKKDGSTGKSLKGNGKEAEMDLKNEYLFDRSDSDDDDLVSVNNDDDFDDVDEDEQLRRIFEESRPQVSEEDQSALNKAKRIELESLTKQSNFSETAAPSRRRVAHAQSQLKSSNEDNKSPTKKAKLSASQMMLKRFHMVQSEHKDEQLDSKMSALMGIKKSTSRLQQQLAARRAATESDPLKRTVGHTIKGMPRVAHKPTSQQVLKRPVIVNSGDRKSAIPANVRQRYLNSLIDELLKTTAEAAAFERAQREEQTCHERSKNRNIYLNLMVHAIKKVRDEAKQSATNTSVRVQEDFDLKNCNMVTSHLQVLAGKAGSVGTWSIERHLDTLNENCLTHDLYYSILRRYVLSEEQLVENGYPRPDAKERGRAVVKATVYRPKPPQPKDPLRRVCDRCMKEYAVNKEGWQMVEEQCVYHWGRLIRKRGNRATGYLQVYSCCDGESNSEGCQVHECHVTDVIDYNNIRGFVPTLDKEEGERGVFALDCEMCNTTMGNELTRVTVIDLDGKTVYESLCKPANKIIDYNTRFSGITATDLVGVTTTLVEIQAVLLSMFHSQTILIGHSLESDLKALKLFHSTVVDTSVVFPHKLGPPMKRALKALAAEHLKRIIQSNAGGHDSAEDALACLDLMKQKVREDVRRLRNLTKEEQRKK